MTAPAIAFACAAAMAWIGLRRYHRGAAETLAIPAATILWIAAIALVITWS